MDLETLQVKLDELNKELTGESTDVEKAMTQEEFVTYATEQLNKAAEEAAENKELAVSRISALKEQFEDVAKAFFSNRELPSVRVFKDPGQKMTTDMTKKPNDQSLGGPGMGFTAKSNSMDENLEGIKEALEEVIEEKDSETEAAVEKSEETVEKAASVSDWDTNFSGSWDFSRVAKSDDYDWGSDPDVFIDSE
jgi:uncharacterized phage infection (PIP) family protein YhgE